jgi:amidase
MLNDTRGEPGEEPMDELIRMTARRAVDALRAGEVSPLELVDAAEARIEAVDGAINALPTRCFDRAREHAGRLMALPVAERGPLAGLPFAVKDLSNVAGVRSTQGSPIYAETVPERSDIMVETLERRGGIVIAKSNTPEFGAGANTFNEVFGKTRNPWNTDLTCGGSSGGAAAALAAGEVWLATGSDLGGSVRIPAGFCSVVGLRPGTGRIAVGPDPMPFADMSVKGPMARTVGDVALMFDAMLGAHPEDPRSFDAPARPFLAAVDQPVAPLRVGFSRDLGISPVDPESADICQAAAGRFAEMGATVEHASPDFSGAIETFQTLRAARFAATMGPLLDSHRDQLKPEVIWNIEAGLALSPDDVGVAERERSALFRRVAAFFGDYDLLLCPTTAVPPFDVDIRYLTEIGGVAFDNYVHWLAITFVLTLTTCPVLSVPCGFTKAGLPVGLQIAGPPRAEAAVLGAGALFEDLAGLAGRVPIDPR